MRVLVIGADGFMGRNVVEALSDNHEVYKALRLVTDTNPRSFSVELGSKDSIRDALIRSRPQAIINCAGIVTNTSEARKNVEFTRNILSTVIEQGKPYPKVIITGSASEYGVVEDVDEPVNEDHPLNPQGDYAHSKVEEVKVAQAYAKEHDIDVIVARIFNPIGPGMGDKFLLTSLLKQINDLRVGRSGEITLSRLDSKRDYIDVRDVAMAMRLFIETGDKSHHVLQNIGSGIATTNGQLLDALLTRFELPRKPTIIETRDDPEPTLAARADISRIMVEYGWRPKYNLEKTIKDIIHG